MATDRERLEAAKQANTLQVLLKVARLVNERAIARVNAEAGRPLFRPALANLFPHIAWDGTRITELAAKLGISKQAVSKLVGELEDEGVVELVADPADARARLVRFTPQGTKAIRQGLAVFSAVERELATKVGRARLDTLHGTLVALLEVLDPPAD